MAQTVKHLPTMGETRVQSLGWEDPQEKERATHSSILAWKIPWTEEPGRLQFMGPQRVRLILNHQYLIFIMMKYLIIYPTLLLGHQYQHLKEYLELKFPIIFFYLLKNFWLLIQIYIQ